MLMQVLKERECVKCGAYVAWIAEEWKATAREKEEGQAHAATQLQDRGFPFDSFILVTASNRNRGPLYHHNRANYRLGHRSGRDDGRSSILRDRNRIYSHWIYLRVLRSFCVVRRRGGGRLVGRRGRPLAGRKGRRFAVGVVPCR